MTLLACVVAFAAGASFSPISVGHADTISQDVVRARRIELVDDSDKARAVFDIGPAHRVRLRMLSSDYSTAMEFGAGAAGSPRIIVNGKDGGRRFELNMNPDDRPALRLGDSQAASKIVLGILEGDYAEPRIEVWGLQINRTSPFGALAGINVATNPAGKDIHGSVYVVDQAGRTWALSPTPGPNGPH
jgi:hypothetical protein